MNLEEQITYATWLSRAFLLKTGEVNKQSCVASAKILTEVLRRLQIPARPMTVSVVVMTQGWLERIRRGEKAQSTEQMDEWWEKNRAWSLGIGHDPTPEEGAFSAHMIVLAGPGLTYLTDPSLDQMARPHRDLPLHPVTLDLNEIVEVTDGEFTIEAFRKGQVAAPSSWSDPDVEQPMWLIYNCFPDDRSFRELPDWVYWEPRYAEVVNTVVYSIERLRDRWDGPLPELPPLPDAPDGPHVARERPPEERARLRFTP